MNLAQSIRCWALQRPHAPALHFEGRDIDYAGLQADIEGAARQLRARGVRHGDRVAFLGFNHPQILVLLFACARLGAILVPLNFRLAAGEHAQQLQDCAPRLLIHEDGFAGHVSEFAHLRGPIGFVALDAEWLPACASADNGDAPENGALDDDLLLVYTSGTTGRAKGAVLTQKALLFNAIHSIHAHDLTPGDHVLMTLPLFHVGGLNIMLVPALYVGARVTLHRRFEPRALLHDLAQRRPTLTLLVPAIMTALIAHPDWSRTDLSSLRMINTGSSVVPVSLLEAFHARGIPAGQVYGSTETCPIAIHLRAEDARRKVGSAGRAAMHCEVRLVDAEGHDVTPGTVGEIAVRGPNVMRTYYGQPQASAEVLRDGWYFTGDLARQDDEGFYWVVGRSRDLIVSGGENIYPAELESVLADCPDITESCVLGVPDLQWGETPVAVIVRRPGSALDAAAVLRLFEGRLARYKQPRRIVFAETLPKTALGKVRKEEVSRTLLS